MTEGVSGSQPHHHWRSLARTVVLNRTIRWCSKPQILIYNEQRPHRALNRRTPAATYQATPKAVPALTAGQPHFRARMDRIDATGTVSLRYGGHLLHLGVGRAYKYDKVRLLIADTDVLVVHHDTGELIAEFILDGTKNYQAKKKHPDPKTEV